MQTDIAQPNRDPFNLFTWQANAIPSSELLCLYSIGAFATPNVIGEPSLPSWLLIKEIRQALGCELPSLISNIETAAAFFSMVGAQEISLQLVASNPAEPHLGPTIAHRYWHVDVLNEDEEQQLWRVVRVVAGTGTQYALEDNVRRYALREYMRLAHAGKIRSTSLSDLNRSILINKDDYKTIQSDTFAAWLGGIRYGLVHRGPGDRERRILLVATANNVCVPAVEVKSIIERAILVLSQTLPRPK